jgi:integrase
MINGVIHQKSLETTNYRRAEREERRFRDELELKQQRPDLAPEMTFGALSARFLGSVEPKPYHKERLKVLLPFFSDIPIGRITKNTALEYRKFRHQQRQLTETTINRDLECLRHILFWAAEEGLILANPLARMSMVRERRQRRVVMSVEEEAKLLVAASPHLRKIIRTALWAGMRRGEILKQQWQDIDFNLKLLFVSHSKTAEGEMREIPLAKPVFDQLWQDQKSEGLVFTFQKEPVHQIKTAWRAAITKAGIRYYRFHDLRHTFNSRLMLAGVQQEIRKALMGHSSGEDVQARYTHVELPAKVEAIAKLEQWVKTQKQNQERKEDS